MNKHGLARNIPADVKREVRQRYGFGCVICGCGIIQYEHVYPEYHDAKAHEADAITILCPGCHARVTSGIWSKDKVKQAMLAPKALEAGFSKDFFETSKTSPTVMLGDSSFVGCPWVIQVFDINVLGIASPPAPGGPFLINGIFFDDDGKPSLKIVENEWVAYSDNWDVEVVGNCITVRRGSGNVVLKIRSIPPGTFVVERLKMQLGFVSLEVVDGEFKMGTVVGQPPKISGRMHAKNCHIGLSIHHKLKSIDYGIDI